MADWMFESKDTANNTSLFSPSAATKSSVAATDSDAVDEPANRELARELQNWLREICPDTKLPPLPHTADGLNALSRIRNRIALATAQSEAVLADMRQKKLEYAAESNALS